MAQRFSIVASFFLLCIFSIPVSVNAQFDPLQISNSLTLSISPRASSPGANVTIVADSSFLDLSLSEIEWFVNGKVVLRGTGKTTLNTVAGALGTKALIEVTATTPEGTTAAGEISIRPGEVDLLFDSDSYVPPFYRGRALPSAGTTLRLQAIVHFQKTDGSLVPENAILYTWKRRGQILSQVSGRGKSSVSIPAPSLFSSDLISVEVQSADGEFSGTASAPIDSTDPFVALYEDHPLFGITYGREIGAQKSVSGSEITLAAVPFFAEASRPDDENLLYEWTVNNVPVVASSSKKNEIVASAGPSNRGAGIQVQISHAKNFFMSVTGRWAILFSSASAGPGAKKNVFESSE